MQYALTAHMLYSNSYLPIFCIIQLLPWSTINVYILSCILSFLMFVLQFCLLFMHLNIWHIVLYNLCSPIMEKIKIFHSFIHSFIIKIILKEFIKPRWSPQSNVLCSYYIKTFLFWKFESVDINCWCSENFRECMKYLIVEFSKCIQNYFFPEYNFLSIMLKDKAQKKELLKRCFCVRTNTLIRKKTKFTKNTILPITTCRIYLGKDGRYILVFMLEATELLWVLPMIKWETNEMMKSLFYSIVIHSGLSK